MHLALVATCSTDRQTVDPPCLLADIGAITVGRHSPDMLTAYPTRRAPRAADRLRSVRLLLALLAFAIMLLSPQSHVYAVPDAPARPVSTISTRREGVLRSINPDRWLVGDATVAIDEQTRVIEKRGKVEIGAWIIVWGQQTESGQIRAEVILVDRPAGWAGPIVQISGVLRKQTSAWWVVEQQLIEITSNTVISGEPKIGALVWVVSVQQGDTLRALAAEVLASDPDNPPVEFEGEIQSISPVSWRVDGRDVIVNNLTDIIGEPIVGGIAEILANQLTDGRLVAQIIRLVDPTAEASLSAMVAGITVAEDGAQRWDVVVFPKSPWAEPTIGTLRVSENTFVDESRAIARTGQWAEVRGVNLGDDEYQADVIRLERPMPVSLTGVIQPAPVATPSGGWAQINGQPVWLGSVTQAGVSALTDAGGNVAVTGIRLGNGVIWAKQVRSVER